MRTPYLIVLNFHFKKMGVGKNLDIKEAIDEFIMLLIHSFISEFTHFVFKSEKYKICLL